MAAASLAEIPDGAVVFIDANVFIYHFSGPGPLSPACSAFLQRVEDGVLRGLTSTVVLIEVLHRLMILEAAGSLRLRPREATRYLKEHPEHVNGEVLARKRVLYGVSLPDLRDIKPEILDGRLLLFPFSCVHAGPNLDHLCPRFYTESGFQFMNTFMA